MSDIMQVLPGFQTTPYTHILPSLDKAFISTVDLISLPSAEIAKRAQVPPAEVAKLSEALVQALQQDNGSRKAPSPFLLVEERAESSNVISTLDAGIDAALSGGIRPGCITEITGESGVGKTQFLLTLLLAVQLPPPHGLGRSALYVSTEAALTTSRLSQLLRTHPHLSSLPADEQPSLDRVLSIQTPDLESQEHILRYQVPVAIKRHNIGLVVIDSIAANYRAEFERSNHGNDAATPKKTSQGLSTGDKRAGQSMAERRPQLIQLGAFLRNLARSADVTIVVANQIADRFSPAQTHTASHPAPSATQGMTPDPLTLDHQQRWFTGWGDLPAYIPGHASQKTPSLGLVWTNQITSRIALVKEQHPAGDKSRNRRWMRVVFAPWAGQSQDQGIEYTISAQGITTAAREDQHPEE